MSHDPAMPVSRRLPNLRLAVRLGLGVAALATIAGLSVRAYDHRKVVKWTDAQMTPSVQVINAVTGDSEQAMIFPGHLEAWISTPIHARVSGYLKSWRYDIGSHVKAGETLAEIDTPELDQQYEQGKANLARAKANARLAELTDRRWRNLLASNSVSKQEADDKAGEAESARANVLAAQADVDRIAALEAFKHITSPFDGTVTARHADIGDLISANNDSSPALFTVADTSRIRLYVAIPQGYASAVTPGMTVKLNILGHSGEIFTGLLIGNSGAVNQLSGTLLAQFEVDNPKSKLMPGAFAEVTVPTPADARVMTVPATVLIFRAAGPQVAIVGLDGKVELRKVHIARDLGDHLQIDQGLLTGDRIVDHPADSLAQGDPVQIAPLAAIGDPTSVAKAL